MQRPTEQEIMKNAEQHAVQDHNYKVEEIMSPELQESRIIRENKDAY